MAKVLFIHDGKPHYCHKKFAESVNADFFDLNIENLGRKRAFTIFLKKVPRNYDIYFTEGLYSYAVLAKKLGLIKKSSKVISLFSDPRLFQLVDGKRFNPQVNSVVKYPFFKRRIARYLINSLDGAICVGQFEAELLRKISKNIPLETVYPFISKEREDLCLLKRKFQKKKNFIFIGFGPDYYYKGVDIMQKCFNKLKDKNISLEIVGDWDLFKKEKSNVITWLGRQMDIEKYLKKSFMGIHLGRGEAFGVSILEMMMSGLPVLVSDLTGAREAVSRVSERLVVSINEEEIISVVNYLSKLNPSQWKILSDKSRKVSKEFTEKKQVENFKNKFKKLSDKIF